MTTTSPGSAAGSVGRAPAGLPRYLRGTDLFTALVHGIPSDRWDAPTPCTAWDVRALVNHVTGEQRWAVPLLAGRTVAEVGDGLDGDLLGADPVGAWDRAVSAAREAFAVPGALDRTVHLSYGPESAAVYCDQMAIDALVHAWDLARGSGQPEQLPADLVDWGLAYAVDLVAQAAGTGLFADPVPLPADAPAQARLLALLGRTP